MALNHNTAAEYDDKERTRLHTDEIREGDARSPFERDRSRIIHSTAFRRLQGKTQVFGFSGSDFFRTRLTHSLEVAQIGKGIALQTGFADTDLVEAICLAHDIGHPPFGHTGEQELHDLMKEHGGFEANAQNIRVLTRLEAKSAVYSGLNLTRATLDGLLKYKKCYSDNRAIDEKFCYDEDRDMIAEISQGNVVKTLECQIMDWADDIAYSVHDLEDGIKAEMINLDTLEDPLFRRRVQNNRLMVKSPETFDEDWKFIKQKIDSALQPAEKREHERKKKARRKSLVANLIDYFVRDTKAKRVKESGPSRYQYSLEIPSMKVSQCAVLKAIVWEAIINDQNIATLERKACRIIDGLFEELCKWRRMDTQLLFPDDFRERLDPDMAGNETNYRTACDYIAGMTDAYAMKVYSRLRQPEFSSIFEML